MKTKIISLSLIVLAMLNILAVLPIYAENHKMDYMDIPQDIEVYLKREENVDFIKVYGSCDLMCLHEMNIEDILAKTYHQEYYISMENKSPKNLYLFNENSGMVWKSAFESVLKKFIKKSLDFDNIESSISGNAKITNCYIFDDTVNHGGLYCYFETTKGNYILFRQVLAETEPLYLVPENEFKEITKKYNEILEEDKENYGGVIDITEYINMSQYKYNPYKKMIITLSVSVAVIAVAIILVVNLKKKKFKNISE